MNQEPLRMARPRSERMHSRRENPQPNGLPPSRHRLNAGVRRKFTFDRFTAILLAVFGVIAIITAVLAFRVVRNMVKGWTSSNLPGAPIIQPGDPFTQATPSGTEAVVPLQPVGAPTALAWDHKSRVTMLVMGLDYEDTAERRTPRTDSMMLVTLDPVTNTAGILSIPRDSWVSIPGFDYGKINTAYFLGEAYNIPGGGAGLAVQTVENFLGVPINYYAQIDFDAFVKFIDALGGLDIYIREEIEVGVIGNPDPVKLYPGVQNLDGATVLAFARARKGAGDDWKRAERQQAVVIAVRDQILTFNMLPTLIKKAPELYNDLSAGVHTNLNLQEMVELSLLAIQVPEGSIKRVAFTPDDFVTTMSPDGQSIEVPIQDRIRLKRDEIFLTGGPVGPAAVGSGGGGGSVDLAALAAQENARISVQNGSSTGGLATRTGEYFRSLGLNVVEETNADQFYQSSTLIIITGKPYTAQYLADMMGIGTSQIYNRFEPDAYADILVILGEDWASSNPMP